MNVIGFSLIVFAAVLASGSALPPSGRIVGGYPADIKKFPYQLALLLKGRLFCGASVLSKRWVLTASHCLENKDAFDVSFRGGSRFHFTGGEVIQAKALFMHPLYDPVSTQYDVALVYTDSDLVGENIKPISVVDEDLVSVPGEYVTISGWGYLSDFSHVIPHNLRYTEVATVLQSECDRKLHYFGGVSETMFCAAAYQTDGCQGDSGGPAVLNGVQVGIVSWGIGCADIRYPGVYTNLANPAIRSWIKEMTNL